MFTRTNFDLLAAQANDYSVSIFIPTYRVGNQQEDQIRFKNALKKAHEKLIERYDLSEQEATDFLAEASALEDNQEFWKNQSDGLAVFIGPDRMEHYACPIDFETMIYVAPEFYLRPLVPLLGEESKFHFLALSRGAIKLYTGSEYSIAEVNLQGLVPTNMDDALMQDTPDNTLGRAGGAEGQRGSNNGVFFSRGGKTGDEVEDLKAYFDRVDAGISDYLCDDNAPLVLGGVEQLIPIYEEANGYDHLYTQNHVKGNLEEDAPAMLHEKAWAVIGTHFEDQRHRDRQLYGDNAAQNEAGSDVTTVVPAAVNGRVAALWLNKDTYVYGEYHAENNGVEIMTDEDKNATELLNLAAVRAVQSGARVYNVAATDLPVASSDACAIYRYAVEADTTNL
ncbi:hypothetical protein LEM8419_01121 [Neolewinella maritima]|uniref:Uncharacterized protein n=1 Tax=Neolewinella maritima TaxID=1383882 RepID=A0ABM9AYM4_9BACT|nr:hypothetical protein [Neolewinella maritima]CAH0999835.1 hypothetical protein LEM8419_01121 [Neolewinella maritima]